MPDNDISLGRGCATRRAADAMMRVLGASQITLRIADASSGDTGSQLGLEPPTYTDVQISPALVDNIEPGKDGTRRWRATISAVALQTVANSYGVTDVSDWLLKNAQLIVRDQALTIQTVLSQQVGESQYLYQIVAWE